MRLTPDLDIDERLIEESFIRASGPGGQNVNKVATAVQLRFDVNGAGLPVAIVDRLRHLAGRRLGSDGFLRIDARRFRSQERNRRDARQRLKALLERAVRSPRPRHRTRPSARARLRRLEGKRRRSRLKRTRSRSGLLDE